MKNLMNITGLWFLIFTGILHSCKKGDIPVLTTAVITDITTTSVLTGGNIVSDGGSEITSRGICWNTTSNPTIANQRTLNGNGAGSFISNITLLMPGTYYTIRAYATNRAGTGYGNELSFVTLAIQTGEVDDIDGNTYKTVKIGTQTWMAENLKTTRYNDNTVIPRVTGNLSWSKLISPAYCWYGNDSSTYKPDYGALYNWYCVSTGKLCPSGWHVPTDDQWTILSTYLGGEDVAGDKMKEEGNAHWKIPNSGVSNSSGFTALPGGARVDGNFVVIGSTGAWWSVTENDTVNVWFRDLDDDVVPLLRGYIDKSTGLSVRCIKN